MKSPRPFRSFLKAAPAFSLVELLAVIALIGVLTALTIPVFSGRGKDMSVAADSLSDVMQQARTRAMSRSTYVYVGLSGTESLPPELAVGVIEARDGLASGSNNLSAGGATSTLQPIWKATFLRGVRLDTAAAEAGLDANSLPNSAGAQVEELETSVIRFPSGMVTRRSDISGSEFAWVIQFSPDGSARLDATRRTVPGYILLGLVPAVGDSANAAGVVIDGPSGAVRVVRPGA